MYLAWPKDLIVGIFLMFKKNSNTNTRIKNNNKLNQSTNYSLK